MKVVPLYSALVLILCILKWTQMDTDMNNQIVHFQKDIKEIISIQKTFNVIPFFNIQFEERNLFNSTT